ncbi:disulfide bond formation protein B [Candidatus Kaiserbacteria bacterium]|nr:disulfide bond formation protein B [Candidatus Kaiserbacteria bacterium]
MFPTETLNYWLSVGTVLMQFGAAAFLALYFLRRKFTDLQDIANFLARWGIWIGFLLSLVGIGLTLFYSEVLGFEPCFLCWWQRVCLYPQALLFGLALWKPDLQRAAVLYSIWLSALGAAFALYHHALQMFPAGTLPCSANGPSCAKITFVEFGYVTFPMMALSLFAFLIVLMLFVRSKREIV